MTTVRGPKEKARNEVAELDIGDGKLETEYIGEEEWAEFDEEVEVLIVSMEEDEEDICYSSSNAIKTQCMYY